MRRNRRAHMRTIAYDEGSAAYESLESRGWD